MAISSLPPPPLRLPFPDPTGTIDGEVRAVRVNDRQIPNARLLVRSGRERPVN